MYRYVVRAAIAIAVALMFASPSPAQSSQANPNSQNPKKQANQVPETGPNEPDATSPDMFDRVMDNVKVTVRADGTIVAELDDSFMEASTVTIGADGSLQFEHFTGVDRAEAAVKRQAIQPALPLLPARFWPLWTPIFEEKE